MLIKSVRSTLVQIGLGSQPMNTKVFSTYIASQIPVETTEQLAAANSKRDEEIAAINTAIAAKTLEERDPDRVSATVEELDLESAAHIERAGTTIFPRMAPADVFKVWPIRANATGIAGHVAAIQKSFLSRPDVNSKVPVPGVWDYQIRGFFKAAAAALNRWDKDSKDSRDDLAKLSAFKTKIDTCLFVYPRFIPFIFPEGGKIETGYCERPLRADTAQGPRVALAKSELVPAGTSIEFVIACATKELEPYIPAWLDYGLCCGLGQWRNSGKGQFVWEEMEHKIKI